VGAVRHWPDRRRAQVERRLVVQHEEGAQGMPLLAVREDLVLGVPRDDEVCPVDPDRSPPRVAEGGRAPLEREVQASSS
jgi:hypothetical protein